MLEEEDDKDKEIIKEVSPEMDDPTFTMIYGVKNVGNQNFARIEIKENDNNEFDLFNSQDWFGIDNKTFLNKSNNVEIPMPVLIPLKQKFNSDFSKQPMIIHKNIPSTHEVKTLTQELQFGKMEINIGKFKTYHKVDKNNLSLLNNVLNSYSKPNHREMLNKLLNLVDRSSMDWKNAVARSDFYLFNEINAFNTLSAMKLCEINYYLNCTPSSVKSNITYTAVIGEDGGYSEFLVWYYSMVKLVQIKSLIIPDFPCNNCMHISKVVKDYIFNIVELSKANPLFMRILEKVEVNLIDVIEKQFLKETTNEKLMLLICSHKIKYSTPENQEKEILIYLLFFLIIAFKTLNRNGTLILRLYDMFFYSTISIVYILYNFFENISIIKPFASKRHSGERFIVANGFLLDKLNNQFIDQLLEVLKEMINYQNSNDFLTIIELKNLCENLYFKNYVFTETSIISENRIDALKLLSDFLKNTQSKIRIEDIKYATEKCINNWKIPTFSNMLMQTPSNIQQNIEDVDVPLI